eukprot:6871688-Heterocapsa_arctica.AAC.1
MVALTTQKSDQSVPVSLDPPRLLAQAVAVIEAIAAAIEEASMWQSINDPRQRHHTVRVVVGLSRPFKCHSNHVLRLLVQSNANTLQENLELLQHQLALFTSLLQSLRCPCAKGR